jgi:hypothetical protein
MQDENRRKPEKDGRVKPKPAGNPAPDDSLNTNHNTKKVALGPNTKR